MVTIHGIEFKKATRGLPLDEAFNESIKHWKDIRKFFEVCTQKEAKTFIDLSIHKSYYCAVCHSKDVVSSFEKCCGCPLGNNCNKTNWKTISNLLYDISNSKTFKTNWKFVNYLIKIIHKPKTLKSKRENLLNEQDNLLQC